MVQPGKPVFALGLFLTVFIGLLCQPPSLSTFLTNPDSGYQLGLGSQVLHGKYPYIGIIFHYGPLVAYMSAFGQWLTGNLIAEVIVCSLGYALSICFLFFITRQHSTRYWAYIVTIASYLLLARFYKWYYWLFPVALLYVVSLLQKETGGSKRYCRLIFLSGIVAGVATLFRFDLGLVFFCFFIAYQILVLFCPSSSPTGFWVSLGIFFCGFMLFFGTWLGILFCQGGLLAITHYFYAIFSGGSGVVQHWGISIPSFDWTAPFSYQSASAAIFTLLPTVYLCCLGFGFWGMRKNSTPQSKRENLFLAAVAIMGLGIYPQGYYRADPAHALQIIPPSLIALPLLIEQHWKITGGTRIQNIAKRLILTGIIVWGAIAFTGLLPYGGQDLSRSSFAGLNQLKRLAHPLEPGLEVLSEYPASLQAMMNKVVAVTVPEDSILVVPLLPQIYYFTRRPLSGLLIGYAKGIHDNDFWRRKILEDVQRNQPKVVVASQDFFEMKIEAPFRESQPELYRYLSSNYQKILYQQDGWLVLGDSRPSE